MPGRREENAGKRMLKHLSAILEKSGVIIFEYHIKTDTLIRYNKELEVEVEIPKYCDYLRDKTRIYPDDRWKAIEFYSGRIKGPIDIREVDDDGYVSRKRLETVSIEEDEEEGRSCILFGMVTDVTGSGIRKSAWNGNWDSTGKKRQPVMVVPVILNMTRLQVCFLLTVSGKRLTV